VTLEDALDELYGASLEDFVAERKRLAKKLGGDEGKELAKLRKPSVAAWVLNQLARRERRDVDLLLDAGHRLKQAQAGVLRGQERKAFEQAREKETDALKRLTKAAERMLRDTRGSAPASTLSQVNEALRTAAISEEGRELLARGRFVEPPQASGFDAFAGMDVPKRAARRKPSTKSPELREAEAALRELERRLRAARANVDALEEQVEAARRRVASFQRK
jgi:nucleotide-binding universal stress UspA family protein